MTRIKCCGMTRVEDALLAAHLGADAIGLVFAARSKRQVPLARAREIAAAKRRPPGRSTRRASLRALSRSVRSVR